MADKTAAAAAPEKADPKKHILLEDGNGNLSLLQFPKSFDPDRPDRSLLVGGRNYEHVREDEQGIWIYRAM